MMLGMDTPGDRPWMAQGERIRRAMARQGHMSQDELAARLNVSQGTISAIVLGKSKAKDHVEAIARILDVPVTWITKAHPAQAWDVDVPGEVAPRPSASDVADQAAAEANLSALMLEQQRQISALMAEQRERDALNRRQATEIAALEADIAQLRAERDRLVAERSDRAAKQRGRRKTTGV